MAQRLENAKALYLEGIRDGHLSEAIHKYTGHRYTQHSTGVGNGPEGFLAFFRPFLERNPDRDIKILHGLEEGRHVFLHAFQSLNHGEQKWVTMDLFDTDEQNRIIEHWDVITAYTETTTSGQDMVGPVEEVLDLHRTEDNKTLVLEYVKQILQERRLDKVDQFVAEQLIQRSPQIAEGKAGLLRYLQSKNSGTYEMLFHLMGQGNYVVTYGKRHCSGEDFAVFDLYRLHEGVIAEQWQNSERILPRDQWGNTGKF